MSYLISPILPCGSNRYNQPVKKAIIDQAIHRDDVHGTETEPTYSGGLSFTRRKYTRELRGVDIAVTGIPFASATTNRPGARFGPRPIRPASTQLSWERLDDWNFDAFDKLAVIDYEDCPFDHGCPETIPLRIQAPPQKLSRKTPGRLHWAATTFGSLLQSQTAMESSNGPLQGCGRRFF